MLTLYTQLTNTLMTMFHRDIWREIQPRAAARLVWSRLIPHQAAGLLNEITRDHSTEQRNDLAALEMSQAVKRKQPRRDGGTRTQLAAYERI